MLKFYKVITLLFALTISFLIGTQFEINVAMEANAMFENFRR